MAKVHKYTDDDGNPVKVDGKIKCQVRGRERRPDGTWGYFKETVVGVSEAEDVARDLELRNKRMAEHLANRSAPGEETVAEVVLWFLPRYKTHNRKRGKPVEPRSYKSAKADLLLFVEKVGPNRLFSELTDTDIQEVVENRNKQRYAGTDDEGNRIYVDSGELASAGTRNRMLGVLQALTKEAYLHGKHPINIGRDVPVVSAGPATADTPQVRVPPMADLRRLAEDLDRPKSPVRTRWGTYTERARWHHIHDPDLWRPSDRYWLFVHLGFSFSEAAGARIMDWERDDSWLVLRKTLPRDETELRDHGKTDARMIDRRVPVPDLLVPVLERLAAYSKCGLLLTGPDGQRLSYSSWSRQLSVSAEAVGVPLTTHQLRHVAATFWIEAAVAKGEAWEWDVMQYGGWASLVEVQRTYGHLTDQRVQRGRRNLNDYHLGETA